MGALRFDGFMLDVAGRALTQGGERIALRPQSFDVLVFLAERSGRLVTSKELIERFWDPKRTTDNALAQCIKDIRDALSDRGQRIIRTVHRRGYVFAAAVSEVGPACEFAQPATSDGHPQLVTTQRATWPAALIALGLLTTVLSGGGWLLWQRTRPPPAVTLTMMEVPSITVLRIMPLGDDTDPAIATLADEIAAGVWGAARGFDVDLRPTSGIKNALGDSKAVARELGVRYIVRGLARRESADLRINVELIEAETARQIWVGAFDYRPRQAGAQSRVAAHIGRTLAAELLRAEVRRPLPATPGAGHYTMLGRALITEKISADRNARAIAYFEKAMTIEPNHFLSLVHFARATGGFSLTGWLPENEHEKRLAKAEDAILRALQQQPKSAHAHAAHGHVLRAKGEYPQAIEAFQLALVYNPYFVHARAELGRTLIDIGKPEQAIAEIERAVDMSPTDISLYTWFYWAGLAALHLSDHAGALNWLQRSFQANPSHDNTLRLMAVALAEAGREEEARKKIEEFLKARPGARLDDWRRPNWNGQPEVTARRERMRATLKRLGVPENTAQAAATP